MEAWSPLMQGNLDNPTLLRIAEKHGKTTAQVVLRWDLQHGVVAIPKSSRAERITENANLFDFQLSPKDMADIDALNENKRIGPDPDVFDRE
jgi:diketogulonate reductase-like aldo/keto reductase